MMMMMMMMMKMMMVMMKMHGRWTWLGNMLTTEQGGQMHVCVGLFWLGSSMSDLNLVSL